MPLRQTEVVGSVVPAIVLYQRRHRLEDVFRMRTRGLRSIRKHLDINEDAEHVLPVTPAVVAPLDVPDEILRLLAVLALLDLMDGVGVEQTRAPHDAEDDVPNVNLGGLLLDGVFPCLRCYSLNGMERTGVARLDQGPHRISRGLVEDGTARNELLLNQQVPPIPQLLLKFPLCGVMTTAFNARPILVV